MNLVCPSHERRTSRVHFDDQLPISAPPMVSSTPMSYPLHHQRWSVPTDASYKASARQPERARFSVPATYGSAGIDINRGRSHYPWPSTQPSNSQQFNPGSPEDFPSRRYTISRVPVNTQTPSQPYDDRRGSDTTLTCGDDPFTPLPVRPTHNPHKSPGQPLRSALRRSRSETSTRMETRDEERDITSKCQPRSKSILTVVDKDCVWFLQTWASQPPRLMHVHPIGTS